MTIKMVRTENITRQVFMAVDHEELHLPVGETLSLEYLSDEDDGIFETPRSWSSFVRGNFLGTGVYKNYYQPIKESTIKRWCYDEKDYRHKFAQQVGRDCWVVVDPEEIVLEYDYEVLHSTKRNRDDNLPTAIEITVKARIRE